LNLRRILRDRRQKLLLQLARAGQENGFRRLYRELYGPVSGYIGARVTVVEDAEDLTAQVFHRFLRGLDRYDATRASVTTWILTIARNAVIDHYRTCKPQASATGAAEPVEELADVLAGEVNDPLADLVRREDLARIQRLLQAESAEIREIFALRFGQGLSCREIADVTGLGHEAVKQRFARTLRKFRHELTVNEPKGGETSHGNWRSECKAQGSA